MEFPTWLFRPEQSVYAVVISSPGTIRRHKARQNFYQNERAEIFQESMKITNIWITALEYSHFHT